MVHFQHPESPCSSPSHLLLECGASGRDPGMERECPWALEQTWTSRVVQWPFSTPQGLCGFPPVPCRVEPEFLLDVLPCRPGLGLTISRRTQTAPAKICKPQFTTYKETQPGPQAFCPPLPTLTHACATGFSLLPTPLCPQCLCAYASLCSGLLFLPGECSLNLQGPAQILPCL